MSLRSEQNKRSTGAIANHSRSNVSSKLRSSIDSNGPGLFNGSFAMYWYTVLIIGVAIVILSAIFIAAINWFLKERRCRKLRHRLIPMYTFDPNEDDDWDEEFFDSNHPLRIKDYQSVENRGNFSASSSR